MFLLKIICLFFPFIAKVKFSQFFSLLKNLNSKIIEELILRFYERFWKWRILYTKRLWYKINHSRYFFCLSLFKKSYDQKSSNNYLNYLHNFCCCKFNYFLINGSKELVKIIQCLVTYCFKVFGENTWFQFKPNTFL